MLTLNRLNSFISSFALIGCFAFATSLPNVEQIFLGKFADQIMMPHTIPHETQRRCLKVSSTNTASNDEQRSEYRVKPMAYPA
jgi:hypothetical protein